MKPVNIIVALTLFFLASCDDEPSEIPIEVTGVIIEESSQEPIENVEIIGFSGGVYRGDNGWNYGEPVSLGTTDKCGQFKIKLPDIIKGFGPRGSQNMTIVPLRLSRSDVGTTEVGIPFEPSSQTFSMRYSPPPLAPFFTSLYLVQSEDGKSIDIGWKIHSLLYFYSCPEQVPDLCAHQSDGNLYIQRSDSAKSRYTIPIEVDTHQMVTDSDLPVGDFNYRISTGTPGSATGEHMANIIRTNPDTLFLVKPPEFPTLNHCN